MAWSYGEPVLYRYGREGRTRFARLGRVLADDEAGVALWIAPGSPQIESVLPDGRGLRELPMQERFEAPRTRRETTWRGAGIVQFAPAVGEWSVWWFFHEGGEFEGWYVNLEAPRIRWEHGLDSSDRALDVWITPDRVARWKDEDEFAFLTGRPGRWTHDQAAAIRATGSELIDSAAAGAFPFDGVWTGYRPDPAWPPTRLPDDWDHPHLAGP